MYNKIKQIKEEVYVMAEKMKKISKTLYSSTLESGRYSTFQRMDANEYKSIFRMGLL